MHRDILLEEAERLLGDARFSYQNQFYIKAERLLVELRELLNSQPELEAGGSHQKRSS